MDPQLYAPLVLILVAVVEAAKRLKLIPESGVQYIAGALGAIGNVLIAAAAGMLAPPPDVFAQLAAGLAAGLTSNGVYDWIRPVIDRVFRRQAPPAAGMIDAGAE